MLFSNSEQIYIEPRNLFASLRPFVDRWIYLPGNIPSEPRRLGRALLATRGFPRSSQISDHPSDAIPRNCDTSDRFKRRTREFREDARYQRRSIRLSRHSSAAILRAVIDHYCGSELDGRLRKSISGGEEFRERKKRPWSMGLNAGAVLKSAANL